MKLARRRCCRCWSRKSGSAEAGLASAHEALAAFGTQFEAAYLGGSRRKLGLLTEREGDAALGVDLLERMAANDADFTLTFRRLCDAAAGPEGDAGVRGLFADPGAYDLWAAGWRKRLVEDAVLGGGSCGADAQGESVCHSAEPRGGGDDRCCRRAAGFPTVRGVTGGGVASL